MMWLYMLVYLSTCDAETGGLGVPCYLWFFRELKARLNYMRPQEKEKRIVGPGKVAQQL